jgi:predicted phosphodiesterase
MRILIVSDIHANLTALEAVLLEAGEVDATWCLGDLVGYGPDPNECIARIRQLPGLVCVLGNHDAAVLDQIDMDTFNHEARISIEKLHSVLTTESLDFLKKLPERAVIDPVTLVHGSPRNPVWEYVLDLKTARTCFQYFNTPYCFIGHTHVPLVFQLASPEAPMEYKILETGERIILSGRAILNPGSVGQPRDHNPLASYAIFDPEENTWENRRVFYDVLDVQKRILAADLPTRHALRLAEGW